MENSTKTLFSELTPDSPADFAAALAPPAAAGHFDELRGSALRPSQSQAQSQSQGQGSQSQSSQSQSQDAGSNPLAAHWKDFFNLLGANGFADLNRRSADLRRQIADNGVTYNVYADTNGPQRPWSLDLFPLIVPSAEWAHIASGISQRTRLLNAIMADVYGEQTLLSRGVLPAALVQGHPGYLRAMQGIKPPGGVFLHIAAFDMARGPDGRWWVVSQRTQAPSGLGYMLENRSAISRLFPDAYQAMQVLPLAASYQALVEGMKAASPRGQASRIVLLTPGPYNETYFEHAYLARYLGLSLVEGSDLLVRGEKLYLKTLQGLERVDGVLKRLDDEFLDPLELRADSTLGVPGLLQVIRAGNVLLANAPGSAFLESSAMLGFLPALAQELLGQALRVPSLSTWWCGEQAVLQGMLAHLSASVIKPTYPGTGMEPTIGNTLSPAKLDHWAARMLKNGEDYTVQSYLPLAQTPTWQPDKISTRSAMLRVFALADGQGSWQVVPGGLARLAGKNQNIASMQHGGSSADVWALAGKPQSVPSPLAAKSDLKLPHKLATCPKPPVTSRAAENLFWLGRYTERAENCTRLAQLCLGSLSGEDQSSQPLLVWLSDLAMRNCLVLPGVPNAAQASRVFERSLIAGLCSQDADSAPASVGHNLAAIKSAAAAVRERLSLEQWQVIVRAEADFKSRCALPLSRGSEPLRADYSSIDALRALESASGYLAAMTGAQSDRMLRDDGWRLLSLGRLIERLNMLCGALISAFASAFEPSTPPPDSVFRGLLALFNSTTPFNAQYQQRRDSAALLDVLVFDLDNPRAIGWIVKTLKTRLAKLAANLPGSEGIQAALLERGALLPDVQSLAGSEAFFQDDRQALLAMLKACQRSALEMSEHISAHYFSHAELPNQSLNA